MMKWVLGIDKYVIFSYNEVTYLECQEIESHNLEELKYLKYIIDYQHIKSK